MRGMPGRLAAVARRIPRAVPLLPDDIAPSPPAAMAAWIDEARATAQPQPTAMALATAGRDGQPSNRMVFVREWGAQGVAWLTDGRSRKAREATERPYAAGVLFWPGLGRQLRLEGALHLLPRPELDAMFAARRPAARAAAWAWQQGEPIDTRADLLRRLAAARSAAERPTAPPEWIGQRLEPMAIEFWQEDPDGLHDRLRAVRDSGGWSLTRIAP